MLNRKLKAVWTMESAEDLRVGLEAENELTDILAKEITAEIDRKILLDIYMTNKSCKDNDLAEIDGSNWRFKKKKPPVRSLDDDWEVSNYSS